MHCVFRPFPPRYLTKKYIHVMKFYSHYLSSCSFRVRIALGLKGIHHEYVAVDMLNGQHLTDEFLKLSPLGMVPALVDGDIIIADSFAILMYLEEKYPQHPLLPNDLQKRALNYQAANIVSSNRQPLQNPRIQVLFESQIEAPHTTRTHLQANCK
ncbi:glutathione S-transferase 2-like isoform X2 [Apium graveolens]|uniref:glutathione S-transferase 2-like isoform X2 n=1 Tax=Apium graveolens TaxID=4045 RepID=UPI003D798269